MYAIGKNINKYPEQVTKLENTVTARIFLFCAVSSKKHHLLTAMIIQIFLLPIFVRTDQRSIHR